MPISNLFGRERRGEGADDEGGRDCCSSVFSASKLGEYTTAVHETSAMIYRHHCHSTSKLITFSLYNGEWKVYWNGVRRGLSRPGGNYLKIKSFAAICVEYTAFIHIVITIRIHRTLFTDER